MSKIKQVLEFEEIYNSQNNKKQFEQLENFLLANNDQNTENDIDSQSTDFLSLYARGNKKIIKAKNYVGVIKLKSGEIIEILPKIAEIDNKNTSKKILFQMLKELKNFKFKTFNIASLDIAKINILDIFIRMFINEVILLTRNGLKSSYIQYKNNENFFKGKINFSQNIKYNLMHKERFFVEYDLFNIDISENRLIKSTLLFLKKISSSYDNVQEINKLLDIFDQVNVSLNYDSDFMKCQNTRDTSKYENVISWCKVFLQNKSFMSYSGSSVAYALLFPMEKIFEDYVAAVLKKQLSQSEIANNKGYKFHTQHGFYHLLMHDNNGIFKLKPDIVVEHIKGKYIILDTKWKILNNNAKSNYGISQIDMYQMYAYAKKYNSKKVIVIYPKYENCEKDEYVYRSKEDDIEIKICFIDLRILDKSKKMDESSIKIIANKICELTNVGRNFQVYKGIS